MYIFVHADGYNDFNFSNIMGQGNSIEMENVEIYVVTFLEHTILSTAGVTSAICCDCDEGLLGG